MKASILMLIISIILISVTVIEWYVNRYLYIDWAFNLMMIVDFIFIFGVIFIRKMEEVRG